MRATAPSPLWEQKTMLKLENNYRQRNDGAVELLCNDRTVLLDFDDFPIIHRYQWSVGTHGYATTGSGIGQLLMHRLLMNANADVVVDHINRDKLDNRRCNLRVCSPHENCFNRAAQCNNKRGYRGVCSNITGKWIAQIVHNGHPTYLGSYNTAEEAANAYDSAAAILFGRFAWRNLPQMPLRPDIFEELTPIRRSQRLTDEEIERIRMLYENGTPKVRIAALMNRSVDTIRRVVQNVTYGNGRRRPSRFKAAPLVAKTKTRHPSWLSEEKVRDISDFIAAGYAANDIAWAVSCSPSAVRRFRTGQTYRNG